MSTIIANVDVIQDRLLPDDQPDRRIPPRQRSRLLPPNEAETQTLSDSLGLSFEQKHLIKTAYEKFIDAVADVAAKERMTSQDLMDAYCDPASRVAQRRYNNFLLLRDNRIILAAQLGFWRSIRNALTPDQLSVGQPFALRPTADDKRGSLVIPVTLDAPASIVTPLISKGPFTSLIVDARGLGIDRAMSPRILLPDGTELYRGEAASPDFAIESGIVSYTTQWETAKANGRAGDNPLVVRAIARADTVDKSDVVLSQEDAKRVLDEDTKTKFLKHFKVIFIID
jgi:hypothetical protein